jgi:hypothetical protein
MQGSVGELIGTGIFIVGGFLVGITIGRQLLNLF